MNPELEARIKANLQAVRARISEAARRAGRDPDRITLVAVSKTKPPEMVLAAYRAGQRIFGENYVQEAEAKMAAVGPGPVWHFIGRLQTNKAPKAAAAFEMIHAVDRPKLAKALAARAARLGRRPKVLIQVNLSGEQTKGGCTPAEAPALAQMLASMESLELKGLMTMPPWNPDPEASRAYFARLRELAHTLARDLPPGAMEELSMGMSGDFEVAIEEGATIVRVGTAIFGPREQGP